MKLKDIKILITGGHLTPALAVLDELQERGFKRFVWVGRKRLEAGITRKSSEFKIIRKKSIRFINLESGKLERKWTSSNFLYNIEQLIRIPIGLFKALRIIGKSKPDIVLSFGGYIALPIVVAAKLYGKKIVTHEQTITTGLSNKLIAKVADKVMVSWRKSKQFYPENKVIVTGNPIRKNITRVRTDDFNFENDLPTIYITGGARGSNTINWRILEILPKLLKQANVIHQTGNSEITKDYKKALKARKRLPKKLQPRYRVKEHIYDKQIGEVFDKSSIIISRAGANTVMELLVLGKAAILVPIPWSSNNEQYHNAKLVEDLGNGLILQQDTITPEILLESIELLLKQLKKDDNLKGYKWEAARKLSKESVPLNAAEKIVDVIVELIRD